MCNIWRRKLGKEITPEVLRIILRDPLFSDIRYVGINGGEPTLRQDLPEIGLVLVNSLTHLKSMGAITNALRPQMALERIDTLAKVAEDAGVSFSVSVSLDGIGETHDRNRGVEGNFESAVKVIEVLRQKGVPLSIGCTLTPLNCYGADDVLLWFEQHDIPFWKFRIGVEIKRLYNEGYNKRFKFTREQLFHLIMFFDKLSHHPKVGRIHRKFYRSLVGQLAFELPREAGCSWQNRDVTLDAFGNLSFCSVASPILGSALKRSAFEIFRESLPERERIVREKCPHCRHDLLGPISGCEMVKQGMSTILGPWRRRIDRLRSSLDPTWGTNLDLKNIHPADRSSPDEWRQILITGWYGTETAGDKAILGELLHFIKTHSPDCQITLTTLDRKVSQQTNLELSDLDGVSLVDMDRGYDPMLIKSVDAVVIGGGPLQEIKQTEYIWKMFCEANHLRKARIIFGCGIGPLYTERLTNMVGDICKMTTTGFFRDEESLEYAKRLGATAPLGSACDPSLAFLKRWASEASHTAHEDERIRIIGLLRSNTLEYNTGMSVTELGDYNSHVAGQVAQILDSVIEGHLARVELLPMHALWVGSDDRIFNRRVAHCFKEPDRVLVDRRYLTLETLLESINFADAAVAMRYHGHLFSMALGIPFLSINYTGQPSKIHSLVKRIDYCQWSEDWHGIDVDRSISRMNSLIEDRTKWSAYLKKKTDELVEDLKRTYSNVFEVPFR